MAANKQSRLSASIWRVARQHFVHFINLFKAY